MLVVLDVLKTLYLNEAFLQDLFNISEVPARYFLSKMLRELVPSADDIQSTASSFNNRHAESFC